MKILVDKEDEWLLKAYKWYKHNKIYARTKIKGIKPQKQMLLHHAIIGRPLNGMVIDHINHNGLDNRRANLRIVSKRKNCLNRKKPNKTGWPGVYQDKRRNTFSSSIFNGGKKIHLGNYDTPEKAHKAYLTAGGNI